MPEPLRTIRLRTATLTVWPDHIETQLRRGGATYGYPPDTDDFRASAQALGYGDDTYWHMVEHDALHSLTCEWLDDAESLCLRRQADDRDAWLKPAPKAAQREEHRVGAFQAALNGKDWGFERLAALGIAEGYVVRARHLLRPEGVAMTRDWAAGASSP